MISTRKTTLLIVVLAFLLPALFLSVRPSGAEIVYEYNFEAGWDDWWADSGVWQVGEPTSGPGEAHSPPNCAATNLDGNYGTSTDSRLISPSVLLPEISGDKEIFLRFWQWFSYSSEDAGYVQISVFDGNASEWSDWANISESIVNTSPWSLMGVELTEYAGAKVRIAFYHIAAWPDNSTGWYIDNIEIITKSPEFTGDFESGWGDWYASRGVWQVGTPTAGPEIAHGGLQCAGTVLDGNYGTSTDSRLISPSVLLPEVSGDKEIFLRFWQWFSYSSKDAGYVQISVFDGNASEWSDWANISESIVN